MTSPEADNTSESLLFNGEIVTYSMGVFDSDGQRNGGSKVLIGNNKSRLVYEGSGKSPYIEDRHLSEDFASNLRPLIASFHDAVRKGIVQSHYGGYRTTSGTEYTLSVGSHVTKIIDTNASNDSAIPKEVSGLREHLKPLMSIGVSL